MNYDSNEFKNILVFLILMGGQSVLTKSPDYIAEKARRFGVTSNNGDADYLAPLDLGNQAIFHDYLQIWHVR